MGYKRRKYTVRKITMGKIGDLKKEKEKINSVGLFLVSFFY